jgi:hypothetical protein
MGIVGAWGTWLMIDVGAVLGTWWTARKERRRLEKEAKAVKEAEQDGEEG